MTLDEVIEYAEQMVEIGETYEVSKGVEDYRQLAEWLTLKIMTLVLTRCC